MQNPYHCSLLTVGKGEILSCSFHLLTQTVYIFKPFPTFNWLHQVTLEQLAPANKTWWSQGHITRTGCYLIRYYICVVLLITTPHVLHAKIKSHTVALKAFLGMASVALMSTPKTVKWQSKYLGHILKRLHEFFSVFSACPTKVHVFMVAFLINLSKWILKQSNDFTYSWLSCLLFFITYIWHKSLIINNDFHCFL